MIGTYLIELY